MYFLVRSFDWQCPEFLRQTASQAKLAHEHSLATLSSYSAGYLVQNNSSAFLHGSYEHNLALKEDLTPVRMLQQTFRQVAPLGSSEFLSTMAE